MSTLGERPELQLEQDVIEWTESVYSEAEQELYDSPDTKLVTRIIDYIEGRQWSNKARYGRSRPVSNKLFKQFIETVGLLTDIQPEFAVTFNDKIGGYSELENLINRMIGDWALSSEFEMELMQTVIYGLIHTGFAKVQWNGALCNGLGDNEYETYSPVNLMQIGAVRHLQDAECVIGRKAVTLPYLVRRYGKVAEEVKPDFRMNDIGGEMQRPGRIGKGQWASLSPVLKKLLGEEASPIRSKYPRTMLKEYWMKDDAIWRGRESIIVGDEMCNWSYRVEPGMKLYPRGRVVVTAGGKVLEDNPNPYWHGKFPFAQYRPYRMPWKFFGLSLLEPQVAMQNIINRISGGIMDMIKSAIDPTLVAQKGALSQSDWDSIDPGAPGGKIGHNNNFQPPKMQSTKDLPAYVMQMKNDIERDMSETSGAAAMSQLMQKKQVPSGDSLDTIMNSRSTPIRLAGRSLGSFLIEVGSMVTSNTLQFSNSDHRIAKYGAEGIVSHDCMPIYGNFIQGGMEPEEFVKKANFGISKGTLLALDGQEDIQVAFALRKSHDISRRGLFRIIGRHKHTNFDIDQNDAELLEEALVQAKIGAAMGGGGKPHGKK